jgi:hypothetical protein
MADIIAAFSEPSSFEFDPQLKSRLFEPDREVLQESDISVEITDIGRGNRLQKSLNYN